MATITVSRNDIQALAERLMNRANSPVINDLPETQRHMKLASLLLAHVAALGMPVGLVSLSYDNGEQEEKTTIEDLARLYGGFSLLKFRAIKTSYPLLAFLLLSCCNKIKPICPDV
jgi:hypothetical protein